MPKKRKIQTAYDPEGPKIEIRTIAEHVCARPRMYTSDGSLSQVLALFAGYDLAGRTGALTSDQSPSEALRWLAETCSYNEYECPSLQHGKILQHFGSEIDALNAIAHFLSVQRTSRDRIHRTTAK
jgi:hypothetical protein